MWCRKRGPRSLQPKEKKKAQKEKVLLCGHLCCNTLFCYQLLEKKTMKSNWYEQTWSIKRWSNLFYNVCAYDKYQRHTAKNNKIKLDTEFKHLNWPFKKVVRLQESCNALHNKIRNKTVFCWDVRNCLFYHLTFISSCFGSFFCIPFELQKTRLTLSLKR